MKTTIQTERWVCFHEVQSMIRSPRIIERRYFKTFEEAEQFYNVGKACSTIWNYWSFPQKETVLSEVSV